MNDTSMNRAILHFVVSLALLFFFSGLPSPASEKNGQSRNTKLPAVRGDSTIAFVSDSQEPIFLEKLALAGNRNEAATELIFSSIVRERPNAVVHLGDMVALGFDTYSWASVDSFRSRLHRLHIPYFPTLGNHELMLLSSQGEKAFMDRFPYYVKTGYYFRVGKLAVVILNSNISHLSPAERQQQESWYAATLDTLEADSTVGIIAVGCHHSPYTNSTIVSPSRDIQRGYLPLFFQHAKCRLFISGHAHASEHFQMNGKDLLVIGGGGGLQQPLLTGNNVRWKDLSPIATEKRMFHYVFGRMTKEGLILTIRMLREDFSEFYDAYTVSIPWPH